MRIGVPTTSYPRTHVDPAGTFVRALCLEFVRLGHRCEVLAPDDARARALDDAGVEVVRIDARVPGLSSAFYGAGVPDNVRNDPRTLASAALFSGRLVREIQARGPRWDAVLSHWALPSAVASYLAFGAARHVAVWHSADVSLARAAMGRAAWATSSRWAADHVFVASHLRARLGAEHDPRAHVVPMGVAAPAECATRSVADRGRLRALVLARLVPIKRVELAIDACARAGVELVIAGDGPERERLAGAAARAGGMVEMVGEVDAAGREALFARCDVLIACSRHDPRGASEGYPVAPREALAHGLVVVATRDPVHAELALRCGEPVVLAEAHELATALVELGRDRERLARLSALAPHSVADDAWPAVAARIERLLRGARPERPARHEPHISMRRASG